MLKFMFFFMFMFFLKKNFWLFKELMYLIFFFFFFMIPSIYGNFLYFFFIDYMSFSLILLTFWIFILMIMSSEMIFFKNINKNLFLLLLLLLMMFLFFSFSVNDFFMFYLFFEMSLIPTIFLILGWGYQPERITAGLYLLFYTLFVSLPLLLSIFYIYKNFLFLDFNLMSLILISKNWFLYFLLIFAFLVKMPMFLVHLWLPKAHVEAPISGSMILAGVLLKLGGYGLLRLMKILILINSQFMYYFIIINLLGGVMISLMCLKQVDFKSLIAYSSVVHMGLILVCMFNFSIWGFNMSLLMMISHGLCSSGLFYLANISYERLMNRSMLISKGLLSLMPSFCLWWFLLISSNMAAPPSLNLLSEIGLLNGIFNWNFFTFLFLILSFFFSSAYCLYLFSYSQHGSCFSLLFSFSNSTIREMLVLLFHWMPLNLLILKSDFFVLWS